MDEEKIYVGHRGMTKSGIIEQKPIIQQVEMKWLSTTIKKIYMDQILSGLKKSEFKGYIEFWNKRINNLMPNLKGGTKQIRTIHYNCVNVGINFLCGQNSYKYHVKSITLHMSPFRIDGILYSAYWEIRLGDRIE